MSDLTDLAILTVSTFVGSLVSALAGVGGAVVFYAVFYTLNVVARRVVEDMRVAIAFSVFRGVIATPQIVWKGREHLCIPTLRSMTPGVVFGALLGQWALAKLPAQGVEQALGAICFMLVVERLVRMAGDEAPSPPPAGAGGEVALTHVGRYAGDGVAMAPPPTTCHPPTTTTQHTLSPTAHPPTSHPGTRRLVAAAVCGLGVGFLGGGSPNPAEISAVWGAELQPRCSRYVAGMQPGCTELQLAGMHRDAAGCNGITWPVAVVRAVTGCVYVASHEPLMVAGGGD